MAQTLTAREQMKAKVASMSTDQILEAIMLIGASDDINKTVVRVALLSEYERREGGEAVDALMNAVGL